MRAVTVQMDRKDDRDVPAEGYSYGSSRPRPRPRLCLHSPQNTTPLRPSLRALQAQKSPAASTKPATNDPTASPAIIVPAPARPEDDIVRPVLGLGLGLGLLPELDVDVDVGVVVSPTATPK